MIVSHRRPNLSGRIFASLLMALILVAAGCAGAAKTSGDQRGGGAADEVKVFAGTWEGTFSATNFDGEMMLVLSKEGENWTGTLDASVEGETVSGDILKFEIEENTCTIHTFISDADVFFTGTVEDGGMAGTFTVYVDGDQADEGTFKFAKK